MTFSEITEKINQEFGEDFLSEVNAEAKQPFIVIDKAKLLVLAKFLQQTEGLYFDHLACITTIDNRQKDNKFEVIYHIDSFVYLHSFIIYIYLPEDQELSIPSLESIWRSADWHEREAYDLMGITFDNHPNMTRILLPKDWEGHPLRKDYKEQKYYHGITVKYENE